VDGREMLLLRRRRLFRAAPAVETHTGLRGKEAGPVTSAGSSSAFFKTYFLVGLPKGCISEQAGQ